MGPPSGARLDTHPIHSDTHTRMLPAAAARYTACSGCTWFLAMQSPMAACISLGMSGCTPSGSEMAHLTPAEKAGQGREREGGQENGERVGVPLLHLPNY